MRTIAACLVCLALLTGCWSRVEVNDLAIVEVVALDRLEDGRIRMATNVLLPTRFQGSSGMQTGGGGEGRPVVTRFASGTGPMEVMQRLQLQTSRRLFWGHLRAIIIGEALAGHGVREAMDFFARHPEVRLSANVVATEGEALDVLKGFPEIDQSIAEAVVEIQRMRLGPEVQLLDFIRALGTNGIDPVVPRLELVPTDAEDEGSLFTVRGPDLRLRGAAAFRDDRLVGWLDETEARGLVWLQGQVGTSAVSLRLPEKGHVSSQIIRGQVRKRATMQGGKPVLLVHASVEDDLFEVAAPLDVSDPDVIQRLEQMFTDDLVRRMGLAVKRLQDLGSDPFGYGVQIGRDLPQVWERLQGRWHEVYPQARIRLTAEWHIRQTGMASDPRGVPRDRIKKQWKER